MAAAVMRNEYHMNDITSDSTLLTLYGFGIISITLDIWFFIPFWGQCAIIWPLAIFAIIIYYGQLRKEEVIPPADLKFFLFPFFNPIVLIALWLALFFPRMNDPIITNFGKLHFLFVFIFFSFGIDTMILNSDNYQGVSDLGRMCWICSFTIALLLSITIRVFQYKRNKQNCA